MPFKPTQEQLNKTFEQDAALGIPHGTTAKMFSTESSWNPHAESPAGAKGYAGMMPDTLTSVSKSLGRTLDPANFQDSLDAHKFVMAQNMKHFGNLDDAKRAYNGGWNKAKWDNPETNAYVGKTTPGASKEDGITKSMRIGAGVSAQLKASGAYSAPGAPEQPLSTEPTQAETVSGQELAGQTEWAGLGETISNTFYEHTLTGRIVDWMKQDNADPDFQFNEQHNLRLMQEHSNIYNNDDMRQYVQGAKSDSDLERRIGVGSEYLEFATRAANTGGMQSYANTAASLATGIADPAAWAATMGLGVVINTGRAVVLAGEARAALVAARASGDAARVAEASAAYGAALDASKMGLVGHAGMGAVENAGLDMGIRSMSGQDLDVRSAIQQGVLGGIMGGTFHLIGKGYGKYKEARKAADDAAGTPGTGVPGAVEGEVPGTATGEAPAAVGEHTPGSEFHDESDPSEWATLEVLQERIDHNVNNPVVSDPHNPLGGTITGRLEDVKVGFTRTPVDVEAQARSLAESEAHAANEAAAHAKDEAAARNGDSAEQAEVPVEGTAATGTKPTKGAYTLPEGVKPIEHATTRSLVDKGVVVELATAGDLGKASKFHAKYGADLPEDAKALYSPQDDKVFLILDRLSPAERANPQGLIMHEVGVHYGLERSIGSENYGRVMDMLHASDDVRVREALRRLPEDTPSHLRGEETLGYLVENHPDLPVVQRIISSVRNWLRQNVRMFKDMEVTTEDAIRYVQSTLENIRKDGRVSADATFPYVWHGGPTANIDKMDLAYAGSGEGNAAFGFGHYVTSEKGTALDYRNKETARRGMTNTDGGLYKLRVLADRARMMEWTLPVDAQGSIRKVLSKAGIEVRPLETGKQLYDRLTKELGSQKAASEFLNANGVHGITYETGRSRGTNLRNSNYVLFGNEHLDIANRYSRGATPAAPSANPLMDFRKSAAQEEWARRFDEHEEVVGPVSETAQAYYSNKYRNGLLDNKVLEQLEAVGTTLGRSQTKEVRQMASMLAEDPSGLNRQHADSAALDATRLSASFREPMVEAYEHFSKDLLTPAEARLKMQYRGQEAEVRIGKSVAEYRLAKRAAKQAGTEFDDSQYHKAVQVIGNNLDAFWGHIHEASKAAGEPIGTAIGNGGFQGFMPQRWLWGEIHRTAAEAPDTFRAISENMNNQYVTKLLNPALEKALAKGPATAEQIRAITESVTKKATDLNENYLRRVMTSPESRNLYQDNHIANMTAQLLENEFHGAKVTQEVADAVKRQLKEIVESRERTEFDLLTEHKGVRLLDYVDTDVGRMVDMNSHRFAGDIALARRGLGDSMGREAAMLELSARGATTKELDLLHFLMRSLSGNLNPAENGAAKVLRSMAYTTMMGKLGLNMLADIPGLATMVGVSGMIRAVGKGFAKDTAAVASLKKFTPGTTSHDTRLFHPTIDRAAGSDQALTAEGGKLMNFINKSADVVGTISGFKAINKALHNGFTPVFMEDLLSSIKKTEVTPEGNVVYKGKLGDRRLGDLGLTPDRIARIKEQLVMHNPTRKEGEAIDWDNWDQLAADDFCGALQRGTGQALLRIHAGEAPRWTSEGEFGPMMAQFHKTAIAATQKQLMRNLFVKDANTVAALLVSVPISALLYRAKLEASMLGMSASDKEAKLQKAYGDHHGVGAFIGALTMANMSGLSADVLDMGATVMGGTTYGNSSSAAAFGYLSSLKQGVSGIGHAGLTATGIVDAKESNQVQKDLYKAWRMVPGSNTFLMTPVVNMTKPD